jgi:hypothetical protein
MGDLCLADGQGAVRPLKIVLLHGTQPLARELTKALDHGIAAAGDKFAKMPMELPPRPLGADLVALIGLHNIEWAHWCRDHGQRVLFLDKGYQRPRRGFLKTTQWRASVGTQQPIDFVARAKMPTTRWKLIGKKPKPWRTSAPDAPIIVANSHEKYHRFYDLPHPTAWVEAVAAELRRYTDRPIWYRPKPSFAGARPIDGLRYCRDEPLDELLHGCHAVITHGSYICADALLAGVPTIALGPAIVRPISSTALPEIEAPRLASDADRIRILANMAYLQYTGAEWKRGTAWRAIRRLLLP